MQIINLIIYAFSSSIFSSRDQDLEIFSQTKFLFKITAYTKPTPSPPITLTLFCLFPSQHLSQSEIILSWFFRLRVWYATSHSLLHQKKTWLSWLSVIGPHMLEKFCSDIERFKRRKMSQSKAVPRWGDLILIRKKSGQVMILVVFGTSVSLLVFSTQKRCGL